MGFGISVYCLFLTFKCELKYNHRDSFCGVVPRLHIFLFLVGKEREDRGEGYGRAVPCRAVPS